MTSCHILEPAGYGKRASPIFAKSLRNPLSLGSVVNPHHSASLNRWEACGKTESSHQGAGHPYKRNNSIPEWHGWHAARRGLGSNLYRLGVPEMVIQRIPNANVSSRATDYIKTAADDVHKALTMLENRIAETGPIPSDTNGTLENNSPVDPSAGFRDVPTRGILQRNQTQRKVAAAHDDAQYVIKVMRNAPRQSPAWFHLRRLRATAPPIALSQ